MQCGGLGLSVWGGVSSEVDRPFVCCYEEFEYEKDLWRLVCRYDVKPVPEDIPSLIVLHRAFSHLYFAEHFRYRARDCNFELRLLWHAGGH